MSAATAIQTAPSEAPNRFDLGATTERVKYPPRFAMIGEPGVGKTTFAACAPGVVIVPTEDGALGIDVDRFPRQGKCETWEELCQAVYLLGTQPHGYKWVALDTANGAYALCAQYVCTRDFGGNWNAAKGKDGFNSWGQGDKATASEMRRLLVMLDKLQQQRSIGVILLSHVGLHKQGNALGSDFQKLGAEMGKSTWALICGWADQVALAHRYLAVSQPDDKRPGKAVAIGNERWLTFEGGPALDAKSRVGYEMPERILLSWDEYERWLTADRLGALASQCKDLLQAAPAEMRDFLAGRMGGAITDESIRALGARKLEQLVGWLLSQRTNNNQQTKE